MEGRHDRAGCELEERTETPPPQPQLSRHGAALSGVGKDWNPSIRPMAWPASLKISSLFKHMGYERLHSEAARTLSALKSFGLIEEAGDRIKLTQRGIEIVARQHGDPTRVKAIKEAAVSP